ncbi:MAG: sn-glycerol-3-phosphate ABC transporter ATP-binding protein UgpC [Sporolactobacillus sp.]|jgi:multiple sugar transport system ATP-binding protein|nr:sn-glycerol-3-phosphate ABC transporter ATP-binding protein UgpC [Sporolactobacillus sp.]MCI1881903.1 sn-glycerol-3-phosphate ABC transporter ATP-binding protein UgpC [Sporolactobacillus sp.]
MAEVRMEHITKAFNDAGRGTVKAVNDESFVVHDKEFVVFVGPSGCGKTTSLRMIAGLEKQTSGNIYIDDHLVNNVRPKDRDIAMVFQDYALYPHMTIRENLSFGLKNLKTPKKTIEKKVNYAAKILNIGDLLDRKPRELSGGQKQRIAVGRAIVRNPKVFLFDEPLSNLDAKLRVQMRVELSELHKRLQATIIYVTHDQVEAMTLGQRIIVMNKGEIQQIATPDDLYEHPNNMFVAGFIGAPPMNFVRVKLSGSQLVSPIFTFRIPDDLKNKIIAYDEKEVILGIRPEDIFLANENATDNNQFAVTLKVVENLGADYLVYFDIGDDQLTARLDTKIKPREREEARLFFNLEKMHLFDPVTELCIF